MRLHEPHSEALSVDALTWARYYGLRMSGIRTSPISEVMRPLLQERYETILGKNPLFSLRSYASRLGLDSSTLSKILNGKRSISLEMFHHLSERLGIASQQKDRLLQSAYTSTHAKQQLSYRRLSYDTFKAISDWYHFAILELMRTRDFRPKARWIAQRLGLTTSMVHAAIQRLERVGLLRIDATGWSNSSGSTSTGDPGEDATAQRKLQEQLLKKAIEALETMPFSKRDQSSLILAINPKHLGEFKKRLDEFRRSMDALSANQNSTEEVYCLSLSLFPLSKSLKEKNHG